MSEIVKLEEVKREPKADLVKTLEDVLARTEAGEFVEGVLLLLRPGGSFTVISTYAEDIQRTIGALEIMKHDCVLRTMEEPPVGKEGA